MSHTRTRRSFKTSWALALGLTASVLLQGVASAEPATTTDASSPAASVPPIRDQWYLDSTTAPQAAAISVQALDRWYLDDAESSAALARSHRTQEGDM